MASRRPLFLGVVRRPRVLGLPAIYAIVWMMGATLALLWLQSLWSVLAAVAGYASLRAAAEYDDMLLEVVSIAASKTPRTKTRALLGGDSYAP